jgi:microcystin-dependent protein
MPGENIWSWSSIAASNGNADTLINWLEGMPRADVNNSGRGMMASIAKWRDLTNGSITTTGTANAQLFTSGVGFTSVPTGLVVRLKIGAGLTNTAAMTLNMDSIGAVAVKNMLIADPPAQSVVAGFYQDFVYNGTNWILLNQQIGFSTGDAKVTMKTVADSGWVMMNDGTIGNAASAATTRANADTEALFLLLWTNVADAWAPVVGGRGGSAAADYAANKKLTLPRQLGRALSGSGTGSGLGGKTLGSWDGEQFHTLTTAEMPVHSHGVTDPTHAHATWADPTVSTPSGGPFPQEGAGTPTGAANTVAAFTGISIQNAGSGAAHNVIQPSTYWNVMIKL